MGVVGRRAWVVGAALLGGTAIGLVVGVGGCGSDAPDTLDASSDAGDSGSDAPPVSCPSGKEPKDDPTCVTNDVGVFVSATGNDANAGTKEKPLATLGAALTKAGGAGKGKIWLSATFGGSSAPTLRRGKGLKSAAA